MVWGMASSSKNSRPRCKLPDQVPSNLRLRRRPKILVQLSSKGLWELHRLLLRLASRLTTLIDHLLLPQLLAVNQFLHSHLVQVQLKISLQNHPTSPQHRCIKTMRSFKGSVTRLRSKISSLKAYVTWRQTQTGSKSTGQCSMAMRSTAIETRETLSTEWCTVLLEPLSKKLLKRIAQTLVSHSTQSR